MDWALEGVALPVSDGGRSVGFYRDKACGWFSTTTSGQLWIELVIGLPSPSSSSSRVPDRQTLTRKAQMTCQ